jgi:antirestriction protein ArdC
VEKPRGPRNGNDDQPRDIYARVTQLIVEAIESGKATYQMPWHAATPEGLLPVNVHSKASYSGINLVALWASAQKNHFETGMWGTYRQWAELGGQVRRGEQGSPVVFWKISEKELQEPKEREAKTQRVFIAKGYTVFNVSQVTGFTPEPTPKLSPDERVAGAEEFFFGLGADIRHGYGVAAYVPDKDCILMPNYERFRSVEAYYGVIGHELAHWSGAKPRLGRDLSGRFGSASYAMEELVAELSSAFLLAKLEISSEPRTDHAGYVENWLEVLKNDKRAIFTAAAKAQQAVNWLHQTHELVRSERPAHSGQRQEIEVAADPSAEVDLGPELDV